PDLDRRQVVPVGEAADTEHRRPLEAPGRIRRHGPGLGERQVDPQVAIAVAQFGLAERGVRLGLPEDLLVLRPADHGATHAHTPGFRAEELQNLYFVARRLADDRD